MRIALVQLLSGTPSALVASYNPRSLVPSFVLLEGERILQSLILQAMDDSSIQAYISHLKRLFVSEQATVSAAAGSGRIRSLSVPS